MVLGTVTISGKNDNSLISDYKEVEMQNEEVIDAFTFYSEKSVYISSFESHTASTIAAILGGLVGGMGGSALASSLVWAAAEIHNNKYGNLKVKSYNSWNIYCGILVKYRYDYFGNNKLLTSTHQAPTWLTTPWNYANQPSECIILAGRY